MNKLPINLFLSFCLLSAGTVFAASKHSTDIYSSAHQQLGAYKYENHLLDQAIIDFDDGDYADALAKFMLLSSSNNAHAEYYLGLMHKYGLGVAASEKMAYYWFKRAARKKHADALRALGKLFPEGAKLKPGAK